MLASMYDQGLGVKQDYAEAVKWHRKAAEQGVEISQISLGRAYASGRGVPQNYNAAATWFREAAEAGSVWAQFYLGGLYYDGRGVPQDYVEAHKWFNLAASRYRPGQERDRFASLRDDVAKRMTPGQIAEAQRLAREWMAAFEKRKKK